MKQLIFQIEENKLLFGLGNDIIPQFFTNIISAHALYNNNLPKSIIKNNIKNYLFVDFYYLNNKLKNKYLYSENENIITITEQKNLFTVTNKNIIEKYNYTLLREYLVLLHGLVDSENKNLSIYNLPSVKFNYIKIFFPTFIEILYKDKVFLTTKYRNFYPVMFNLEISKNNKRKKINIFKFIKFNFTKDSTTNIILDTEETNILKLLLLPDVLYITYVFRSIIYKAIKNKSKIDYDKLKYFIKIHETAKLRLAEINHILDFSYNIKIDNQFKYLPDINNYEKNKIYYYILDTIYYIKKLNKALKYKNINKTKIKEILLYSKDSYNKLGINISYKITIIKNNCYVISNNFKINNTIENIKFDDILDILPEKFLKENDLAIFLLKNTLSKINFDRRKILLLIDNHNENIAKISVF